MRPNGRAPEVPLLRSDEPSHTKSNAGCFGPPRWADYAVFPSLDDDQLRIRQPLRQLRDVQPCGRERRQQQRLTGIPLARR